MPQATNGERAASSTGASSAEHPWPVREVSTKVEGWIARLGTVWVEGQITQLNRRPGMRVAFLNLRDPSVEMSLQVMAPSSVLDASEVPLVDGARVIVYARPQFFKKRGQFSLQAIEIRSVGIGELLARIERLRKELLAEGLFDREQKKPLPFLPYKIGLITGRGSAAERDVVAVATDRWPAVQFDIRNTAVQGPLAVSQIVPELQDLDADSSIDVIILARGGGSVEDLLPFSDETLIRAMAQCTTPIVSAIGHEPDHPLSDDVADLRAATPTDAAKRVVPDAAAEARLIADLRGRSAMALRSWVQRESHIIESLRSRPVLLRPLDVINQQQREITNTTSILRRDIRTVIDREVQFISHQAARLGTLGPAQTLARGYSIVQRVLPNGEAPEVVSSITQSPPGASLRIRVIDGIISAAALSVQQSPSATTSDATNTRRSASTTLNTITTKDAHGN